MVLQEGDICYYLGKVMVMVMVINNSNGNGNDIGNCTKKWTIVYIQRSKYDVIICDFYKKAITSQK